MDKFVVFGRVGCIGLGRKSSQAFVVDIDSEGVKRSDDDIDPEVEFVTVDEERVGDVFTHYAELVEVDFIDVVN